MKSYDLMYDSNGFHLIYSKSSRTRRIVESMVDTMCVVTRHHFCQYAGKVSNWEYQSRIPITHIKITKAQAVAISPDFAAPLG